MSIRLGTHYFRKCMRLNQQMQHLLAEKIQTKKLQSRLPNKVRIVTVSSLQKKKIYECYTQICKIKCRKFKTILLDVQSVVMNMIIFAVRRVGFIWPEHL